MAVKDGITPAGIPTQGFQKKGIPQGFQQKKGIPPQGFQSVFHHKLQNINHKLENFSTLLWDH